LVHEKGIRESSGSRSVTEKVIFGMSYVSKLQLGDWNFAPERIYFGTWTKRGVWCHR